MQWIIIALLVVALVCSEVVKRNQRREICDRRFEGERVRGMFVREIELKEAAHGHVTRLEAANAEQRDRILELTRQIAKLSARAPARMTLAGLMAEDAIAEHLNGTESTAIVRAICAHLSAKIVTLSDRATDAPREKIEQKGETIAGYSSDQRLHDAGGASYLAETLAELQELTRAKEASAHAA